MHVQNYGWPTGPAKIWLRLSRRPFEWPRASGKHDPCYYEKFPEATKLKCGYDLDYIIKGVSCKKKENCNYKYSSSVR